MRVKIESFSDHSGTPEWHESPRLPAFRINGKLRDERLNEHGFRNLQHTRKVIAV